MSQVTIELDSSSASKLNSYINSFGNKDLFIDKFIHFQINKLKREIARIQIDLSMFEKKYNKTNKQFYSEFESGKLKDSNDFIIWAGLYELQIDSRKKLKHLI